MKKTKKDEGGQKRKTMGKAQTGRKKKHKTSIITKRGTPNTHITHALQTHSEAAKNRKAQSRREKEKKNKESNKTNKHATTTATSVQRHARRKDGEKKVQHKTQETSGGENQVHTWGEEEEQGKRGRQREKDRARERESERV